MTTDVVINTSGNPFGKRSSDDWLSVLRRVEEPVRFLCEVGDPLAFPRLPELLEQAKVTWELHTMLENYMGWRSLRGNAVLGNRLLVEKCKGIHAFFRHPRDGGVLSLPLFLRRVKELVVNGYSVTAYLYGDIAEGAIPYVLRTGGKHFSYVTIEPWKMWPTGSAGRSSGNTCDGSRKVIGPDLFVYPCVVAAAGWLNRSATKYRDGNMQEHLTEYESAGRERCTLRRCPNVPEHSQSFGVRRFIPDSTGNSTGGRASEGS